MLPLAEGRRWVACRSNPRCLTLFKLTQFALLVWRLGTSTGGGASGLCLGPEQASLAGEGSWAPAVRLLSEVSQVRGEVGWEGRGVQRVRSTDAPALPAPAAPPPLVQQSKLFSLLHLGFAFRYARWRRAAALQTVLGAGVAASVLASPCGGGDGYADALALRAATLIHTAHWLGYNPLAGATTAEPTPFPPTLDPCRVLVLWLQVGGGWGGGGQ